MPDPILAKATREPPKKPGAFAQLVGSVENIARRLLALESRPLARDGRDGAPGRDGAGIKSALINSDGRLVLTLTTGDIVTLDRVVGKDGADGGRGIPGESIIGSPGADGRGIASLSIDGDGRLCARFSDGVTETLDRVVGLDGRDGESIKGDRGDDGRDGRGVKGARINDAGELYITFDDGAESIVGRVTGRDGKPGESIKGDRGDDGESIKGDPGESIKGDPGLPGRDGVGIADVRLVSSRLVVALTDDRELDLGEIVGAPGRDADPNTVSEIQSQVVELKGEIEALQSAIAKMTAAAEAEFACRVQKALGPSEE